MKNILIFLSLLFVIIFSIETVQANNTGLADSPWPMFHGGLKSTGLSSYDTSKLDGTIKWRFKATGGISTSPAIATDGTIYIGDEACNLYAVNPDGTEKWKFNTGVPITSREWGGTSCSQSSPAVAADGTIYFLPMTGNFFAVSPDGKEKWRYPIFMFKNAWSSPAVLPDGTIIVGSESYPPRETGKKEEQPAFVYALNPDGTLKWKYNTGSSWVNGTASMADDGTIYTAGGHCDDNCYNVVYAFNPDGTKKWIFTPPNGVLEGSVTIGSDGTLYFTVKGEDDPRNAYFFALNPDSSVKWRIDLTAGSSISPAIDKDGNIYFGDWDGVFYSFNPTGEERWRAETTKAYETLSSSPAIGSDSTIYFGSITGEFFAYTLDGKEKWKVQASTGGGIPSSPAIAGDGTIYVATMPGELIAFGEKDINSSGKKTDKQNVILIISIIISLAVLAAILIMIALKKPRLLIIIFGSLFVISAVISAIIYLRPADKSSNDGNTLTNDVSSKNVIGDYKDCPHHMYGTWENGFYGAYQDMTTKDLSTDESEWIKTNCPNTTWPEQYMNY